MKINILGLGKVGSLYERAFRNPLNSVLGIDPHPRAESVSIPIVPEIKWLPKNRRKPDLWVIASPTALHLSHIEKILEIDPTARVITEKPICAPGEIDAFLSLIAKFPEAKICVNDLYSISPATSAWVNSISEIKSPLQSLKIEMSKNRQRDDRNGRFQDLEFGALGYEGFHLFSLLSSAFEAVGENESLPLSWNYSEVTPKRALLKTQPIDGPRISLATSVAGEILLPEESLTTVYQSDSAQRYLRNRFIPAESEFRYRYALAEFLDGSKCMLVLEPFFNANSNYKNNHLIRTVNQFGTFDQAIINNQFETAIHKHIKTLFDHSFEWRTILNKTLSHQRSLETQLPNNFGFREFSHEAQVAN
jgi:hypothetical protein